MFILVEVGLRLYDDRCHRMHPARRGTGLNARNRAEANHTQLCVLLNGLLLSNLETLGLGGNEIIFVVVGHG